MNGKNEKKSMELIVNFFNESEHKRTMNKMRQLLGQRTGTARAVPVYIISMARYCRCGDSCGCLYDHRDDLPACHPAYRLCGRFYGHPICRRVCHHDDHDHSGKMSSHVCANCHNCQAYLPLLQYLPARQLSRGWSLVAHYVRESYFLSQLTEIRTYPGLQEIRKKPCYHPEDSVCRKDRNIRKGAGTIRKRALDPLKR